MTKEYTQTDKPLPTGYTILPSGEIESFEHSLQQVKDKEGKETINVNTKRLVRPFLDSISNESLEVLIGTYLYGYMDKPKAQTIHNLQLLSALFELKLLRSKFYG
jgi:hypothetical protein